MLIPKLKNSLSLMLSIRNNESEKMYLIFFEGGKILKNLSYINENHTNRLSIFENLAVEVKSFNL